MEGYFKVHRKILQSQVFAHQTALKIWIWCLAKVTFKERFVPLKSGKGEITVHLMPGQFIFGRFKAEEELNIDGYTIYRWMQKFSNSEFDMIKIESNNQYSIITICNWEEYQNADEAECATNAQPMRSECAANAQPKHTNKNDKKDKNVKEVYGNIPPTIEEIKIRIIERGITAFTAEKFHAHYQAKGWMIGKNKMKNWDAALTTWNTNNNGKNGHNQQFSAGAPKRTDSLWNRKD